MNHFPQNLANFRRSKRLRSNQACELLQLSRAALKAYEKGECMPTPEMLVKLARIMGVSVAGLVGQRIIFCDNNEKINNNRHNDNYGGRYGTDKIT